MGVVKGSLSMSVRIGPPTAFEGRGRFGPLRVLVAHFAREFDLKTNTGALQMPNAAKRRLVTRNVRKFPL